MQHEKILDKLDGLADFPWSFKASKDLDRVFDKYGNCLIWLATDKEHDKRHGEFIAAAPMLIVKLLEEIDQLKEQVSKGKKECKKNARTAKKTSRNS
jgi:hypothetical protein